MFTPEDEIDELDYDIGKLRRRKHDAETSLYDGRLCNQREVEATIAYCDAEIRRLERARNEALAAERDADDAYMEDVA